MGYARLFRGLQRLSTALATVLIATLALCAQSCRSSKTTTADTSQLAIDDHRTTTDKEVIYCIDTVVLHEADTAMATALVRCDSLGNAYLAQIITLQGGRVKQNLTTERVEDETRHATSLLIRTDAIAQATEDHVSLIRSEHTTATEATTSITADQRHETTAEKKPPASPVRIFLLGMAVGAVLMLLFVLWQTTH